MYSMNEKLTADGKLHADCAGQGDPEITFQRGTKQTLIFNPPAILTIHLRRFEQVRIALNDVVCSGCV